MLALLTSCGRPDLLKQTLDSLLTDLIVKERLFISLNEDKLEGIRELLDEGYLLNKSIEQHDMGGKGQSHSIQKFMNRYSTKYYLHLEDDWHFDNSYAWIGESIRILEENPTIIKVLARKGSPHPCEHDQDNGAYGLLEPWTSNDGKLWHGFSWNPGITRLDLLKQFTIEGKSEEQISEDIYKAGYKVAELAKGVYTHIGDGRSTH